MASPSSRSELADYCRRQLGAPVLEINVADEQVDDVIDDAVQFFQERHFDGVSQAYLKYKITQDDIDRGRASMETNKKQTGITTTTATAILLEQIQLLVIMRIVTFYKFLLRLLV